MRIQGPNPYLNIYNQQKNQKVSKDKKETKDQVAISSEAKLMQMNKGQHTARSQYVQTIKERVQSGEYEMDHQQTAQKLLEFWKK
ncbi:MAG TPA: flagellar biosynthesis anti-sigma factor FlgM [Pseudogracilibacillus sp.]|nr:flagellar biosynthesis anti-sigma factor FlgM [Pseudogracilibacillus sp.]